jgi:SAM-dependent methyltransferase
MKIPPELLINFLSCTLHNNEKLLLTGSDLYCIQCQGVKGFVNKFNISQVNFLPKEFLSDLGDNSDVKNDKSKWTSWRKENYQFIQKVSLDPASYIVDIGAGFGFAHDLFPTAHLVSIDFTAFPNTNIVTDLKNDIPLVNNFCDLVMVNNLLEHIFEPKIVLQNSYRILKSGSSIVITVPFLMRIHQEPHDYLRYTHYYLTKLLEDIGFRIKLVQSSLDFGTFETLSRQYFQYPIDNGEFMGKLIWQFQKVVNFLASRLISKSNRMDFTSGYMILAEK